MEWVRRVSLVKRVTIGFAGMGLLVLWVAVDEVVADWRSHPWVQVIPEFLGLERYSGLVANLGTALLATVLLLVGAAQLLTRPKE